MSLHLAFTKKCSGTCAQNNWTLFLILIPWHFIGLDSGFLYHHSLLSRYSTTFPDLKISDLFASKTVVFEKCPAIRTHPFLQNPIKMDFLRQKIEKQECSAIAATPIVPLEKIRDRLLS